MGFASGTPFDKEYDDQPGNGGQIKIQWEAT